MGSNLFRELRRRHVYRVAAAYAAVGWLAIEVTSQVFPVFHIPDWAIQLVVLLVALGFPIALVLAWAFEMTPEGVRRTEAADSPAARAPEHTHRVGWYFNFIIMGVLAVTVAVLLWHQSTRPSTDTGTHAAAAGSGMAEPASSATSAVPVKSIAVLPFESLSADPSNGYFAGGIQAEILTALAKIRDLKVIARSSTQRYSNAPTNMAAIALQLGVANLLTGSVQKAGERVRISVQLVDARNENQIWARSYDRTLDDVFEVQSEVARTIAGSLKATLTGAERKALAVIPTTNSDAYSAYLKGQALAENSSFDRANTAQLLATYRQAVDLDPRFALAWAELVKYNIWQYWEGYGDAAAARKAADTALQHAQALAPHLPQVDIARGWFLYYGKRQFANAREAFRAGQKGLPNNDQAWVGAALVERRLGRWQATTRDLARARELNPNGLEILNILGESLIAQRRFDEAEDAIDAGLALKSTDPYLLDMKAICLFNAHRDWKEIDRVLSKFPRTAAGIGARGYSALYQRDYARASRLFGQAIEAVEGKGSPDNYKDYIPTTMAMRLARALSEDRRGNADSAARIYRRVKANATSALRANPDLKNARAALHVVRGMAEAGLGQHQAARADGQQATQLIPEASDAIDGPAWQRYLARIHALNGDADRAIPLLAHLLTVTTTDPQTRQLLAIDPVWDPIRGDPRFQALLEKYSRDKPAQAPSPGFPQVPSA